MGNGTNKGQGQVPPNSGANAVSKDQTPAKQTLSPEEIEKRKKRAAKREKIIRELLETERVYVRRLELCIIHFMLPLDPSSRGHNASVSQRGSIFQRYTTDKSPSTTNPTSPVASDLATTDEKESKTGGASGSASNASSRVQSPSSSNSQQMQQFPVGPHPYPNAYKIMNAKDHKTVFSDLKTICALNQTFLQGLEAIIDSESWDQEKARLSDPFEKFSPFFTMYQNYMNNYDAATICYHKYSKKSDFVQFEEYARQQCEQQNLPALMILPIQRLPRYKLLLSEIVKNTEEEHVDYQALTVSLSKIDATTRIINERMKEHEARANVRKMENRFMSTVRFVKASRSFVTDGKLTKIDRTGKAESLVFLLFSDMLVYASEVLGSSDDASGQKSNKLKLRQELPIDSVFGVENIEASTSKKHNFENRGFEIYSSVKSFIVYAATLKEKQDWMKILTDTATKQKQILSNRQSTANQEESKVSQDELFAAPLLIPDDYSDVCMRCGTKFTTINRRHHCRYCGFIVCGKCGNHQLASRKDRSKVVKVVCTPCYEENKDKYPKQKGAKVADDDNDNSDDEKQSHSKTSSLAKLNPFKGKK